MLLPLFAKRHLWLLFVTATCLCVFVVEAQDNTSKLHSSVLSRREKSIRKTLSVTSQDEWGGSYYYGDGLGANVTLLFAPESGFVFTWHGCLGLYDQNYGDVKQDRERLRLVPKLPNDRGKGLQGIADDFYLIRWGQRHYLIPPGQIVQFANAVNAGYEPRKYALGRFFLKRGDETKDVSGQPPIPPAYADYLLSRPLDARITSIGANRTEDSFVIHSVVLNVGRADGVKEGMEFFSTGHGYVSATVTKVDEHTSEAELTVVSNAEKPSRIWRLTTRHNGQNGS